MFPEKFPTWGTCSPVCSLTGEHVPQMGNFSEVIQVYENFKKYFVKILCPRGS